MTKKENDVNLIISQCKDFKIYSSIMQDLFEKGVKNLPARKSIISLNPPFKLSEKDINKNLIKT